MITEINAKSLLRRYKRVDSWFLCCAGLNLYRGCLHDCSYCDGRAERYQVKGEFGKEVAVKVNAPELLQRELDPARKRIPFPEGYIILGGGVGDSYQPAEAQYELMRQTLELCQEFRHPVHLITKSLLVRRDFELLSDMLRRSSVLVSVSFSTLDDEIARVFEPHVPSPTHRLQLLRDLKTAGIPCGMMLMPVLPYISDSIDQLSVVVNTASRIGLDYVIMGLLTLKKGRQRNYFGQVLKEYDAALNPYYEQIYKDPKWGSPASFYSAEVQSQFGKLAREKGINQRIPIRLFPAQMSQRDRVAIMLEHLDHYWRQIRKESPFKIAAGSIWQLPRRTDLDCENILQLKGVGRFTERVIRSFLTTGECIVLEQVRSGEQS